MDHIFFMKRALELAQLGFVSPNPRVGAVIVKDSQIIAEGYHQKYGSAHAEVNAFNQLPDDFDFRETTLYVTLEPCSHHGKTPPCADLIIEKGISNVVVACTDPNPLVSGKGIQHLKNHGINVIEGICQNEALALNEAFFYYIQHKKPYILWKVATTLDGKIATKTGNSKWISSEKSREEVQVLRSVYSAIMVGINTVLKDNPMLNSRIPNARHPKRIIVDSNLRTPFDSNLVQTAKDIPTFIATNNTCPNLWSKYQALGIHLLPIKSQNNQVDLHDLIDKVADLGIDSILLEGGATLATALLEQSLINKIRMYIAPKIFGGDAPAFIAGNGIDKVDDALHLTDISCRLLGSDLVYEGYPSKNKIRT